MPNTQYLVLALMVAFALMAVIVFRQRRWQGAVGWILIAGAFIIRVLQRDDDTLLSIGLAAVAIVVGLGFAGYDYVRFERPKRQRRRAERLAAGHQTIAQRLRRRPRFRRRAEHREEP